MYVKSLSVCFRLFLFSQSIGILLWFHSFMAFSAVEHPNANTLKPTTHQVDSINRLASNNFQTNWTEYERLSLMARVMATEINYQEGLALTLMNIGNLYLYQEDYSEAFSQFYESLDLYEKLHDIDGQIIVLNQISGVYLIIHDQEKALIYIQKAEKLVNLTKDLKLKGNFHLLYGKYYNDNLLSAQAEKEIYLAIIYFKKAGVVTGEARAYRTLGDVYLDRRLWDKSIHFYQTAIEQYNLENRHDEVSVLYTRIAHVYQQLNDLKKVLYYNLLALKLREKTTNQEFIASSLINIGTSFLKLNQYDSSLNYLNRGLKLVKSLKKNYMLENAYLQMYHYYLKVKDYKEAFKYYEHYSEIYRRVMSDRNNAEIQKLDARRMIREAENKTVILQNNNELQKLEIRKQHIQSFVFETVLLLALILVIFIYSQQSRHQKSQKLLNALNEKLSSEIILRAKDEETLQQSEEQYRFIAENSLDVISHLDGNLKRLYISPSCEKLYGYSQDEMYKMKDIFQIIHPDYHQHIRSVYGEMILTKQACQFYYKAIRKDGSEFWAESAANPVSDQKSGELIELITVVRDVTVRKKHEEELAKNEHQKDILLREIHHRVKNNFAIMSSLMNMQKEISHDDHLAQAISELQLRVRTMSLVHEQLYNKENIHEIPLGNYLLNLTHIISDAFNNQRIKLHTEIEERMVNIELALPLGLIVNEILTNAFKYAFPDQRCGNIFLRLTSVSGETTDKNHDNKNWELTITDNGIGLPQDFSMETTAGMGSQIIRILIEQIEAKLVVGNQQGAYFRIQFTA